jgi:oligosaccharide repeat unit polymerase
MTITLILISGVLTVLLGRWMFGQWFNHVGLYGFIWCGSLLLFHSGLIAYYPLELETWLLIGAGWLAFTLGAAMVVAARFSLGLRAPLSLASTTNRLSGGDADNIVFRRILVVMNAIIVVDAIYEVHVAATLAGSVNNILALGNLLYKLRATEGLPGMIPYLSSMGFIACLFAGVYTSRISELKMVAVIPLLVILVISIVNMNRVNILIAGLLFISGMFLNKTKTDRKGQPKGRLKSFAAITFVAMLLLSGAELIRSNRQMVENFAGATTALTKLNSKGSGFITPSVLMYATVHHGVFNQYLKHNSENPIWGNYTFAPFWRTLAKLGFDTKVNYYQPMYFTPIIANTGSYLREFHADFGIAGSILGPFAMGFFTSIFWFRSRNGGGKLLHVVLASHMMVMVGLSVIALATQLGSWLASLIFGLLISSLHDKIVGRSVASQPELASDEMSFAS